VDLSLEVWSLAKKRRSSVNVSVSTFVPKPLTPFQWCSQLSRGEIEANLESLKRKLRRRGLNFKWQHPGQSVLEGAFARGDRRLGGVVRRAWESGARFDGWTECFDEGIWQRAFEESGLSAAFYSERARDLDEVLPWDHLSAGVEKRFLAEEYGKSLEEAVTSDCRWAACSLCGACDHKTVKPVLQKDAEIPLEDTDRPAPEGSPKADGSCIYHLVFSKAGSIRFIGQLETGTIISRAINRAALPAAYSGGHHPHMKLSFVEALPLGYESESEDAWLTLTEAVEPERLQSELNALLPQGIRIERAEAVTRREGPFFPRKVTYGVLDLTAWQVAAIIRHWVTKRSEILVKTTKRGEIRVPLGEILLDARRVDEGSLEMDVLEKANVRFRPSQVLERLLEETPAGGGPCRIRKLRVEILPGEGNVERTDHQC
jgi:radical SAM-linked protein